MVGVMTVEVVVCCVVLGLDWGGNKKYIYFKESCGPKKDLLQNKFWPLKRFVLTKNFGTQCKHFWLKNVSKKKALVKF